MKNKVIFLGGPTASGKSALALRLAEALCGAVVNADSMQVYRDLRVVTARPSPDEEARVPHHLYGYRDGVAPCSAAAWGEDARAVLDSIWAAGGVPVVVGGTGLYFRSLWEGLAPVPDIPDEIREEIRARMGDLGSPALHAELEREDPAMAARLEPGDRQRIARALEVWRATGRSLLDWQALPPEGGLRERGNVEACPLVLAPPRDVLYDRCNERLMRMMIEETGLDELRALMDRKLDPALPVMKALAVPEFIAHLRGELDFGQALEQAQAATRQYAKRQLTWFRNQFPDWPLGDEKFLERFISEKYPFIKL